VSHGDAPRRPTSCLLRPARPAWRAPGEARRPQESTVAQGSSGEPRRSPGEPRRVQETPGEPQGRPGEPTRAQEGSRDPQESPGEPEGIPGEPRRAQAPRESRTPPGDPRRAQASLRGAPGEPRRPLEESRGPQESPGSRRAQARPISRTAAQMYEDVLGVYLPGGARARARQKSHPVTGDGTGVAIFRAWPA
jgi:hypothetical protein